MSEKTQGNNGTDIDYTSQEQIREKHEEAYAYPIQKKDKNSELYKEVNEVLSSRDVSNDSLISIEDEYREIALAFREEQQQLGSLYNEFDEYQINLEIIDRKLQEAMTTGEVAYSDEERQKKQRILNTYREERTEILNVLEENRNKVKLQEEHVKAVQKSYLIVSGLLRKKEMEIEAARKIDETLVIYGARIKCKYGLRDSALIMRKGNGAYIKGNPLFTAKDILVDDNILNFGGCNSSSSPGYAEKMTEIVKEAVKEKEGIEELREKHIKKLEKLQTRMYKEKSEKCFVKCQPIFTTKEWLDAESGVIINGSPVLRRKCELVCKYGGKITIQLSGQPEGE